VKGLFVPYLTPDSIEQDINRYIDKIDRYAEELENSFNDNKVTDFINILDKIQEMLQSVFARQCESYAVALIHTAKQRGLSHCQKTLQQAIAEFLLLSIEMQKAQNLGTTPAPKYKNVEKNEEAARNMSAIGRLIDAGDYAKAQKMASDLKETGDPFARLYGMLAAREYGRAGELARVMEEEHIGHIRQVVNANKTVLAVDDMPQILFSVSSALKGHYKVFGAPDGMAALDIMNQHHIDLFFIDIEMPGMDGFELTRRIRADARYAKTPLMFFTGVSTRENITRAISVGCDDFIVKPAYGVTLLAKARKYLD
jgi:CheY-like chemotaxis protein